MPARSGTRSRRWAGRGSRPGSRSTRSSEAIDVIRGIWDATDARRRARDGEYYHVRGAKRGPAPAHDIEIWLGAYKPRMLRLTGAQGRRLAAVAGLPEAGRPGAGQPAIDEAALAAGRDPREIRRLLNIRRLARGRLPPGPVGASCSRWSSSTGSAHSSSSGDDPTRSSASARRWRPRCARRSRRDARRCGRRRAGPRRASRWPSAARASTTTRSRSLAHRPSSPATGATPRCARRTCAAARRGW